MLALQYRSYGGPEVVEWTEAPEPHAGPGKIRIQVRGASVNPVDWKRFSGAMSGGKQLDQPEIVGWDGAGVVDEVGEGVTGVAVGDEVFGVGRRTAAEYAVLNGWARKPQSVGWPEVAAAGTAGETTERVLRLLDLKPGDWIFIDGGAGGVGGVAVQVAVARGLRVVASGGPDNQDYLRELGATPVVYGDGVADRVRTVTDGQVAGVFDVAGKTPIAELVGLVADPAQVVSIANFEAPKSGARVTGGGGDSQPAKAMAETAELLADGRLKIPVRTYPIHEAAEAFGVSLGGHIRGKLVLVP